METSNHLGDDKWQPVDKGKTFLCPTRDQNEKKMVLFEAPVSCRYVKIHVQEFSRHPSMRVGLIVERTPVS